MSDYVLWRRLTETDFNAMHGMASPHGRGGGAMHVALGVSSNAFPINRFLMSSAKSTVTIKTKGRTGKESDGVLTFSSNPNRRGGEWLIRDQFSHRHPAWTPRLGFPIKYSQKNPPYVFVFRVGSRFYAAFSTLSRLSRLPKPAMPEGLLSEQKGIRLAAKALLDEFDIPTRNLLDIFQERIAGESSTSPFDPKSIEDGRNRIMAAVVRRLGQQSFRRKLLAAYESRCAMTKCGSLWVLEAAHITPYRGIRTNAVSNGLLLRADIHTLFDLALISIEPSRMKIRVSSVLASSEYAALDGRRPIVPDLRSIQPSMAALEQHFSSFQP